MIADYACAVGENPLWNATEKKLLWTDITGGLLFRYDPEDGKHERVYSGRPVGGFTIQQDGSLLLFKDRGTITCWNGPEEITVVSEIPAERNLRFNDVIADPAGRVFCGTYTDGLKGRLYRLDIDGSLTMILDGTGCSNGMRLLPIGLVSFTRTHSRTAFIALISTKRPENFGTKQFFIAFLRVWAFPMAAL
jgi:sugar lactone lactonase YvrE